MAGVHDVEVPEGSSESEAADEDAADEAAAAAHPDVAAPGALDEAAAAPEGAPPLLTSFFKCSERGNMISASWAVFRSQQIDQSAVTPPGPGPQHAFERGAPP